MTTRRGAHNCQPGDGCPRAVQGPRGRQFRIEEVDVDRWSVHEITGEWGRGGKDIDKPLRKKASPRLVGYWTSYTEAVAAVCT